MFRSLYMLTNIFVLFVFNYRLQNEILKEEILVVFTKVMALECSQGYCGIVGGGGDGGGKSLKERKLWNSQMVDKQYTVYYTSSTNPYQKQKENKTVDLASKQTNKYNDRIYPTLS